MYPESIQKLIEQFKKFPGIGPRAGARLAFYLIDSTREQVKELLDSIVGLRKTIKICSSCFKPFEEGENLCEICSNPGRDNSLLCIVEKQVDLFSIEKTNQYKGLYFILGGTLSPVQKDQIDKLRFKELLDRVKNSEFKEIIIAVNPTTEGEATALYLQQILKPLNITTTRLGRGLPIGAELEYADEETLSSALECRR